MGPRAVRITAEDFLIPAEFGELRLAEHSAGQIGGVHLTLVEQQGRTCFGSTYQQVPLRVLPPFQFPGKLASLVYYPGTEEAHILTRRPACSTVTAT